MGQAVRDGVDRPGEGVRALAPLIPSLEYSVTISGRYALTQSAVDFTSGVQTLDWGN